MYLAIVLDLFSSKVVGWALAAKLESALVEGVLVMAVGRRQPPEGLLHHSDRGSQYGGQAYQHLLQTDGLRCSISRKAGSLGQRRGRALLRHAQTGAHQRTLLSDLTRGKTGCHCLYRNVL